MNNQQDAFNKQVNTLRVLHTSDWHIGKRLHNEARYDDFAEFLSWLLTVLCHKKIDVLVVAGDVFDTMTPSNKAQELYYQFLAQAIKTPCRHMVVVAGNHDSPSFLDAPKSLFKHFSIHIVGTVSDDLNDELLVLNDDKGEPELIIACVPYLRDKDVRTSHFGESLLDKDKNTRLGIAKHYQDLGMLCQAKRQVIFDLYKKVVPVIATGHLFATGASVSSSDDGMRDLYVGSLGAVRADSFGDVFDYVALGHIHAQQMIGGHAHIRYSGSPLAMGFGECYHQKYVLLVDFDLTDKMHMPTIYQLPVPVFRRLERVRGDWTLIDEFLDKLMTDLSNHAHSKPIWLDVEYIGKPMANLSDKIAKKLANQPIVAINIKNKSMQTASLEKQEIQHLQSLKPSDVFMRLLQERAVADDDRASLKHAHDVLLQQLQETDTLAQ